MPIVRIGSTYSSLQQYKVNDDQKPIFVNSKHFTGYVTVRLQNHHYKNEKVIKTNSYFENHRRFFSFQFQGRFKATNPDRPDNLWTFDDILFCAETEESINPPMGASLVVKFARYIDPGFTADGMFLDKRPWVGSWLVCGMNVIKVWKANEEILYDVHTFSNEHTYQDEKKEISDKNLLTKVSNTTTLNGHSSPLLPVDPWIYYDQRHLNEDTSLIFFDEQINFNSKKRRNYFFDPIVRQSYVFNPSLVYAFDFFNNFTNFSTMNADMFVKFSMARVLKNQPLRFVCRDKKGDSVFFVIEIDYLDLFEK
ncbi:26276_t:CDS:1 [Gigaspora margarita]|uniref:26276_t:CDS:1 n=1 Tax=Gigaspora margarita TaxID=4874 RepID=A0ABN7W004_GIGMA|nr:26276_t:CDS:1 [Gigaspora margarita]